MTQAPLHDETIQRAVLGDRAALMGLLQQYGPIIRQRFGSQIPKRWQSVLSLDDLMQETYTDAFMCICEFAPHGEESFVSWLTTIARHNLLNALRMLKAEKRGGQHHRVELAGGHDSADNLCELLGVTSSSPGRTLSRTESRQILLDCVQRLPDNYRIAVQMMDLEGRSVHDAATAIDRTPGAIYMLRARAHDALKKMIAGSSG